MKKLIFGLVATVMFSFIGMANNNTNDVFSYSSPVEINNENVSLGIGCIPIDISYSYGGFSIGTSVYLCCWRMSAHENRYDCGLFTNPPTVTSPTIVYVDVEKMEKKIIDSIDNGTLKKFSITDSKKVENEGKYYAVMKGDYDIKRDSNGRYLELKLIEVSN